MEPALTQRISLFRLARATFYIGAVSYGGGPAIIAYMHNLFTTKKGWVSERDFGLGLSISQMLPGANAVSVVTFLGYRMCGRWGALVAPVCFLLPATVLILLLSALYFAFGNLPALTALFIGLGAAVVALLVSALVSMGRSALKDTWSVAVALAAFLILFFTPVHVLLVVLGGGIAGWLIYRHSSMLEPPAEPPEHLAPGFWLAWLLGFGVLAAGIWLARATVAAQLFIALLRVGAFTFGGGFASIPLFQHEAVALHQWLTPRQFLDGIGLGQVTPGPVFITGTFIGYRVLGFLGGFLGTVALFAPGVLATYFVARLHSHVLRWRWLRAAIRGIVAAFIGVLLTATVNLARQSITDWRTVAIAVLAAIVLLAWKKDPLWVILGTALISPWVFR